MPQVFAPHLRQRLRRWLVAKRRRYTPIRRYTVRAKHEWALIYIDERFGSFMCQSTFGTYAYIWRSIGPETLKEFLRNLNFDYFMGKTRPGYRRFDRDRSVASIRDYILQIHRDGSIDKATARLAWNDLDANKHDSNIRFIDELTYSKALMAVLGGDYYEFARELPDSDSRGFWEIIWPAFLEQIGGRKP